MGVVRIYPGTREATGSLAPEDCYQLDNGRMHHANIFTANTSSPPGDRTYSYGACPGRSVLTARISLLLSQFEVESSSSTVTRNVAI
jgi:hypothetical protein